MLLKEDKRLMRKEYVYALFILKFILGLYLIYWTISMTLSSDVGKDADNAFLSNYHQVDSDFNKMSILNQKFEEKYNIKFDINGKEIDGLSVADVFLAQRAIQAREIRKDMILLGENSFSVHIQDKEGNPIKNKKIDILVTKNTTHAEDVKLIFSNEDTKKFEIGSIGYWNITGTVEVNGDKGYFYIKTNAKR
jgi:hypothetical protein